MSTSLATPEWLWDPFVAALIALLSVFERFGVAW